MATMTYDGVPVCATTVPEQIGESNKWSETRLSWQVVSDLPNIHRDAFRGAVSEALDRWSAVCGLTFYEGSGTDANLLVMTQRERQGGVLADCELPYPGIGRNDSLKCRVDEADAWAIADNPPSNRVGLVHVLTHEFGHGIGLGHGPQGCLMQPTYSPRMMRPQDWDIVQARLRYDRPRTTQPAQPADPPTLGGRRRFDGRLLRDIAKQFPGLIGIIGDPSKIPDVLDLPDGLGDGIELASVRLTARGLSVRVMGREVQMGSKQ